MSSTTITNTVDNAQRRKSVFAIFINGEPAIVHDSKVSYEQAVRLAFPADPSPDTTYTVTFGNAKGRRRHGELVEGQSVAVKKKGTEFDVTATGKS